MKKTVLLLWLLAICCSCMYFQCKEDICFNSLLIATTATNIKAEHLDNRGASPLTLSPGSSGWKNAYGFRLSASTNLQSATDTIGVSCPVYFLSPAISGFEISTLTGMGAQFPPGATVTDLFKYVQYDGYVDIVNAPHFLSNRWANLGEASGDFLLLQPPAEAGWQQLKIKLTQEDGSERSMVTDSIFLQ